MGPQLVRCGMCTIDGRIDLQSKLQWGRNLFVAECPACMTSWPRTSSSFNGAATCSLRNVTLSPRTPRRDVMLQWGRNLFVAEWGPPHGTAVRGAAASMGPQLVRCGMGPSSLNWIDRCFASMGPQLVRCGMRARRRGWRRSWSQLQWGRNLFVAE